MLSPVRFRLVGRSITALAAVVLAAVGLAAACSDGGSTTEGAARVAGTEQFSPPAASTTTAPGSRVVWPFDTEVPPEVIGRLEPNEWLYGYAVLPDSSVVLGVADRGLGTAYRCRTSLLQIDPRTGLRTKIASGILPTLSPDGSKLAYARERAPSEHDPTECGLDDIAVRTVATGQTVTAQIPRTTDTRLAAFSLRWSPDGSRLRFYLGYENSDAVSGPLVFDVNSNSTIAPSLTPSVGEELSARFAPQMASSGWEIISGVWLRDGGLAVTVSCGMGCLSGLPRDEQPQWYRVDDQYVLRSLNDEIVDVESLADLQRCIGISYC